MKHLAQLEPYRLQELHAKTAARGRRTPQ